MVGAPNLADPAWQAAATDAQIAAIIRTGRGKMPAFDLPEQTVERLIALVRSFSLPRAASTSTAPTQPGAADPSRP